MRRIALLCALVLVVTACGDDAVVTTTVAAAPGATAASPGTTEHPTTTGPGGSTEPTVPPPADAGGDCQEVWPEDLVQTVIGDRFTLLTMNVEANACTYAAIPDSVTLSIRDEDQDAFEAGRFGAEITATTIEDIDVCDGGWIADVAGAVLVVEAHSAAHGRTYTATVTGPDLEAAPGWGTALVGSAC